MSNKNPNHAGHHMFSSIFAEFRVTSEQQLVKKMQEDSETIPCSFCRNEFSIDQIKFIDDDPYCKRCLRNGR